MLSKPTVLISDRLDIDYTRRQRTLGTEEKKRGQRLFGNLLGTLNRFTKEEKSKAASDRVNTAPVVSVLYRAIG